MKKLLKNKENIVILIVSLVAFITGCFAIGWLKALCIIGIADVILFLPNFLQTRKKKRTPSKAKPLVNNKSKKKVSKTDKKRKRRKIIKIILIICFSIGILIIAACVAFAAYIVKKAPEFNPDNLYHQESSILYMADGTIFAKLGAEKRENITYDDLPEVLVDAIVATEDSRFFQHNGFDLPRFLVASVKQVLTHSGGGASTLTMQVVKNDFTTKKQTITRKFTDIYMAIFQVEERYSKKEIIEFYVNSNYLGSGAYGVEQACQTYFGKSAKDINIAEAALIAGLFQAPDYYDPWRNPERAEERRQTVLYLMERHGYITHEEREIASALTVDKLLYSKPTAESDDYQAFIDAVVYEIIDDTGKSPYKYPMEVWTTLDSEKQLYLNKITNGEIFNWENDAVEAGIAVVDVNTGALLAVGGDRHRDGELQWVNATREKRQIGSTSKPLFDYGPGIEYENWSTGKLFMDEPYTYSNGTNINNWDRKYNGLLTLREALSQSRNIPALKAFQLNKNSNIQTFVKGLHLNPDPADANGMIHESHSIGGYRGETPLTMAAAYAAIGNGGYYITPHSYTKIVDRDTKEVTEKKITKTRVISEETAYIMADLLQSAAKGGLYGQANINNAVYGAKTGTSNYPQEVFNECPGYPEDAINDLWVNGVSPDYAISVWYGYRTRTCDHTSTAYSAGHRRLFQAVGRGIFKTGSNWTKPEGVIEVEIEKETEPVKLASQYTPAEMRATELFKSGTEPTEVSDRYDTLENVKNLKSIINKKTLTLTWDAVSPNAINDEAINAWARSIAMSEDGINQLINNRKNANSAQLGTVVYEVYSKNDKGELTLIKSTDKTTIDIPVSSKSPTTYVVKTAYTIFKANRSSGAETKISLDDVETVITAELSGQKETTLTVGDTYKEPSPAVIVLEDLTNVTDKATVKKVIKDSAGKEVTAIKTDKAETYTITYSIRYKKFTDTLTRKIVIKEKAVEKPSTPSNPSQGTEKPVVKPNEKDS